MNYIIEAITKNSHTVRKDKADSIEELRNILQELKELEYEDEHITITPEDRDTIAISWHIDDVKNLDDSLTDEQCREVLQSVKYNHDAILGVNWDTIQYCIDLVKENK